MNVRWLLAGALATCAVTGPGSAPARAGDPAGAFVVIVDYTADAAHFEQLKHLIEGVARASIAEPGCRRFDIVTPADKPDHVTLYEVFDDKAAFGAHAAAPHFKQFVTDSGAIGATRVAMPGSMILSLQKP